MNEVKAKLSYLRISPRKVRLVADLVRSKKALDAVDTLTLLSKKAAKPIKKLIESAIANAKNNFNLEEKELIVWKIMVDEGPIIKRWKARARGRAATIRKRTSHVNVILSDLKESKKEVISKEVKKDKVKKEDKKQEDKKDKK